MMQENLFKYNYRFGNRQLFNVLLGIGMIGIALFLFFEFEIDNTRIILICLFFLLGIFPLLFTIHYILVSKEIEVTINPDNGSMQINQNGGIILLKIEDIKNLEIHEHKGLGLYEFDFDYAKYNFKNGKYCIVTCFMTKEYFIPNGIDPIVIKEFLPLIWNRNMYSE